MALSVNFSLNRIDRTLNSNNLRSKQLTQDRLDLLQLVQQKKRHSNSIFTLLGEEMHPYTI